MGFDGIVMQIGDLVKVTYKGRHIISVILSVEKRRNSTGTHDTFAKVSECGTTPFHYLNVEVVSESR